MKISRFESEARIERTADLSLLSESMNHLEAYKQKLATLRSDFIIACSEVIQLPLPSDADFAAFYYQVDGQSAMPLALAWMTLDGSADICYPSPISRFADVRWEWSSEDIDEGINEEAEDFLFQWLSECWKAAGGARYSPLFVLYDQGGMDIYDLCTLEELTDEAIEQRLNV